MITNFLITSVITGEQYFNYVPIFIYSIQKSYPDYTIKIFHTESNIPNNIYHILKENNWLDKIEFWDASEFPKTPYTNCGLRWFLPEEKLQQYDYAYIGDIDMFIIKETPSILDYHLEHCKEKNMCYSNKVRPTGFAFTGLHFIIVNEYYNAIRESLKYYENRFKKEDTSIFNGIFFVNDKYRKRPSDEHLLFRIINDSGLPIYPNDIWERRIHGFHLGIIRDNHKNLKDCFAEMNKLIHDDKKFLDIVKQLSPETQKEINTILSL